MKRLPSFSSTLMNVSTVGRANLHVLLPLFLKSRQFLKSGSTLLR